MPDQETTAVQRLGHVFGWIGNGVGGLLIIVGLSLILYQGWKAWEPDVTIAYKFGPFENGKSYIAVGSYGSMNDARLAVEKKLGLPVNYGPYGDWNVFDEDTIGTHTQNDLFKRATELARSKAIKRARQKSYQEVILVVVFAVLPGAIIVLLGQGLRYIFAGPRNRKQRAI